MRSCLARVGDWVIRMDESYSEMTKEELLSERKRLADELEDYEEMAAYHSVNSPAHATMTERKASVARLQRMKDAIVEVDELLKAAT
jgi:hypothetical protein